MAPAIADTPTDSLTYYTEQIRSEIVATVLDLKHKLDGKRYAEDYAPVSPVRAEYVKLGYLLNTHHGKDVFGGAETLCGLRVEIDRSNPRTISVGVDNVEFGYETEEQDADGEYYYKTRSSREDLVEQSTW